MTATPAEVRAPRGARLFEIDWSDGVTSLIRHVVLRGFCPCAVCQGHKATVTWVDVAGDDALEIADLGETGNYAIRIAWADGHQTGIYSFKFLRELGELHGTSIDELKTRALTPAR